MRVVHWSSSSTEWATPSDLFAQLHRRYRFTLDAAASAANAMVGNWYGPDHPDPSRRDALSRDWAGDADGGGVWLNPPYGKAIAAFLAKADDESRHGVAVVCLVPARTDARWFRDHCVPHRVEFLPKRLRFDGHRKDAPFPSAIVVMRNGSSRYTCGRCGESFVPRRADAVYCSGRCRVAAHRQRTTRA